VNESEIQRTLRRIAHMEQRLGLPGPQSEGIADRLHWRDQDGDDRRMCVECRGLRKRLDQRTYETRHFCEHGQAVLLTQLQRCPKFSEAKHA
jgi:hypothetical protein